MLILVIVACTTLSAETKGRLLLKSLLIPGWGQVSLDRNYGYAMMTAEVGIISSLFYLDNEEQLKKTEAYEYALKYAHIQPGTYSAEYYAHLSKYSSSGYDAGGYNAMIRQAAIAEYPGDPEAQTAYINQHIYTDDYAWNWDDTSNRRKYGSIRADINNYQDYAKMVSGVMILNHLVSAVDILRMKADNPRTQLSFGVLNQHPILMLDYHF